MLRYRSLTAPAVALLLASGCGGENLLAPPDGVNCTQGRIAPGDSVTGHLGEASCLAWTPTHESDTRLASWTLQARKNTAYVIRAYHIKDGDGDDTWQGTLVSYGRDAAGDPVFLSGAWKFGAANPNGGRHQEAYIVPATDQTISLRLESTTPDTGSYTLVVESCPAIPLTLGQTIDAINVTAGCLAMALDGGAPERVVFATFPGDTAAVTVTALRTSGASLLYGRVTGPDLDAACWTNHCLWQDLGAPNDTLTAVVQPPRPMGLMLVVGADTAGTTIVDLTVARPTTPASQALPRRVRNPNAR